MWYKTWWGILLIIIFFYILVPYLIWTKTDLNKSIKIIITILCGLLFVFGVVKSQIDKSKEPEKKVKIEKKKTEYKVEKKEEIVLLEIPIKTKNDSYYKELKSLLEEVETTNKMMIASGDKTSLSKFTQSFKHRVEKLRDKMEKDKEVDFNLNTAAGFMSQTYVNILKSFDGKSEDFNMNIEEIKKSLYEYAKQDKA